MTAPAPAPDSAGRRDASGREAPPPPAEWAVAALGLVLLLATLGYLVFDAATGGGSAPDPSLRVLAVQQQEGRYLVRIRVENRGRDTAGSLRVTGQLRRGDEVLEQSETEFQHLPGRSSREAGLFFQRDPAQHRLELSARSYQQP